MERNRCVESGCPGYCCEDIDIEITKSERTRVFSMAEEVGSVSELADIKEAQTPGVFCTKYTRKGLFGGDFYVVAINGVCPNRVNGGCSKHKEREHAARNFAFGSPDCNAIRAEHGLPPVFVEPVE